MKINSSDVVIQPYPRKPERKSPLDKDGMRGIRPPIKDTFRYQPIGTDKDILRIKGSLRMKRGDTSIQTLAKTYGEFCTLVGWSAGMAAAGLPAITSLADARNYFGTASISGIRKDENGGMC